MGVRVNITFAIIFSVMMIFSSHISFVQATPSSHVNHPHVTDPNNPLTPEDIDTLLSYGIDEETALQIIDHAHSSYIAINYPQRCADDVEFETMYLEDGVTPNPNYLRDDAGAYVFMIMGWGGSPLAGLPENHVLKNDPLDIFPSDHPLNNLPDEDPAKKEFDKWLNMNPYIQWLYDNNAQVIRSTWSWLPVDGLERYGYIELVENEQIITKDDFRCHQPGPTLMLLPETLGGIRDATLVPFGIDANTIDDWQLTSALEGPLHEPEDWDIVLNQWKNLMAKPRTQELIEDKKVIVFGHSFGGNAASRIGQHTESEIDLLAIADPVGTRASRSNTVFDADCSTPFCSLPKLVTVTCNVPSPGADNPFTVGLDTDIQTFPALVDPVLKIKHLRSMPNLNNPINQPHYCYAVKVYDESKEGYWAFLTPEARKIIDRYLNGRKLAGEKLGDESPLFTTLGSRWNTKNQYCRLLPWQNQRESQ